MLYEVITYARLKLGGIKTAQAALRWTYNRMRRALADVPHEMPDQDTLRDLAAPYYHSRLNGGEGDMLVGKALWAHRNGKAHMICELSPYSCMPNTMSVGAMAAVLGKVPDLLYAPLEIKGDAEVHALRITSYNVCYTKLLRKAVYMANRSMTQLLSW